MKKNRGIAPLHMFIKRLDNFKTKVCIFSCSIILICIFSIANLFADASVIQAGGPTYPLTIDGAIFTLYHYNSPHCDSVSISLSSSMYEELRYNIDSTFSYADALRMKRKELGYHASAKYSGSTLTFTCLGLASLKLIFNNNTFKSCKLVTGTDKYPFVVVFTKGFSQKLASVTKKKIK